MNSTVNLKQIKCKIEMSTKLESKLERNFYERIRYANGQCIKLYAATVTGIPDRLILMPEGRLWFVELKKEDGRVKPRQKVMHRMLKSMGFKVRILWSKEDIDNFINEILQ